ncbi:MAG: pyruvate kinase [Bernardetiaceae bacterium]|nr:pyruvate kinase [Bernardetiaceae bacterium]
MRPFFNKTKIIATIGPASQTREQILQLIVAGVDVFRLNFSHGSHDVHAQVIKHIREINKTFDYNIGILQDLQGPKIRIGEVQEGGIPLVEGQEICIRTDKVFVGNAQEVSSTYEALPDDVVAGNRILIDDGKLELEVIKVEDKKIFTKVIYGGLLESRKGMNLPDTNISAASLTPKDHKDLLFGLEQEVDWVALSFVRTAKDMENMRKIIDREGKDTRIIAKIERPEAVANIDEIIDASDAIMVARGDLGVEIPPEEVPIVQKNIVKKCNFRGKPVIIATQMMDSMIQNPRPTRAETNDVANAVMDGADTLMLSGETAVGKYPIEVIKSMVRTIHSIEINADEIYNRYYNIPDNDPDFTSKNLVQTACRLAESTNAKAMIAMTQSGYTAFQLAGYRPRARIFVFTGNPRLLNIMSLVWGVRAYYYNKFESTDATFADTQAILSEKGFLEKGDHFINMASMPINKKLKTNVLKLTQH